MFLPTAEQHRAAPSLPGKKPVMPPPIGKKPIKQADPRLMAQTDDHKVKESQKGKCKVTSRYMYTTCSCQCTFNVVTTSCKHFALYSFYVEYHY